LAGWSAQVSEAELVAGKVPMLGGRLAKGLGRRSETEWARKRERQCS